MKNTYEVIKTLKADELYLVNHIATNKIYRYRVVKHSDPYIFMTLKNLRNKNRINIIDVLQEDDYIAVIEEVLTGESLFEIINNRGALPLEKAVDVMLELFNALDDLHKHSPKIINRNINPVDIMITNDDVIKITNFNYAVISNVNNYNRNPFEIKSIYNAEELSRQVISEKADIYSLGVVLNFMITGESSINNYEDSSIGKVIKKATDRNYNNRYSSIEEFKNALIKKKVHHFIGLDDITKSINLSKDNMVIQNNLVNKTLDKEPLSETKLDDYEQYYEKYHGNSNDNSKKFGSVTREDDKKTVNFPGFRTGVWWKRVLSVIWIIVIILEFTGSDGNILKRFLNVSPLIAVPFFACNYNNVQSYLPISKSNNKIERVAGVFIYSCVIGGVLIDLWSKV